MTWLQGLIVKIVMLTVTVGVLFWAGTLEKTAEPEQLVAVQPPAADAEGGDEPGEAPQVQQDAALTPAMNAMASAPARPVPPLRRAVTFPLDINRAGLEELMALPGIGDILAQRMVEYRKRHGGFRRVDELRKVRGIGEKRMEQLRPLVVTAGVRD